MKLSRRTARLGLSRTAAVMQEARAMRQSGADIIDFGPGEPDFLSPAAAGEAAAEAISRNFTRYTEVAGHPPLREAVALRLNRIYGCRLDASNVIITNGAKQAIFNLCMSLFEEGDEVLVPRPYWVTFPEAVRLAGAEPAFVDCPMERGFKPETDTMAKALRRAAKGMILNYPNNPTGAVLNGDELQGMAEFARREGIFLISDETYDAFVYGEPASRANSFLRLWDVDMEGLAVVGSLSKTFAMTGWRVGYAVGTPRLIQVMTALQSHQTGNASSISQAAALAVLNTEVSFDEMLDSYRKRRDLIISGLNSLPGIHCPSPEGAFYVFPDVRRLMDDRGCRDSSELAAKLLREQGVATVPGSAFGAEGHLRFSYALSLESIQKGLERLKVFCKAGS